MADYRIAVAEVRLRVDSEEEAAAIILAMQQAHGIARVALRAHPGRAGAWFVRGTLQYQVGDVAATSGPVPATGPTRRLRKRT